MLRRSVSLFSAALTAAVLLAGCGNSVNPMLAQSKLGGIQARDFSVDDAANAIEQAEASVQQNVEIGLPAVLLAPTDVNAQRGMQNILNAAVAKGLPQVPAEADDALAANTIASFAKKYPEVTDKPELLAYLQGIADRLTTASHLPSFKVHLFDVPAVNAFNAGGNSMVVFTGILPVCHSEAELAGVMAHEMTHGLKRHMVQGWIGRDEADASVQWVLNQRPAPQEDDKLAAAFMSTLSPAQQNDYDFVLSYLQGKVGKDELSNLTFAYNASFTSLSMSRDMEAAADQGGVRLMAAAGYDPGSLSDLFGRMMSYPDGDTRYYNHPALGSRMAAMKSQIVAEGLKGKDRGVERYQAAIKATAKTQATGQADVPQAIAGMGCFAPVQQRPWTAGLTKH